MNEPQDSLSLPTAKTSDFAKRLQIRRKQLNISKQKLATAIGVSLTTIQLYESTQLPKAKYAIKLASVLNCSLDWLLVGNEYTEIQKHDFSDSRLITIPFAKASLSAERHEFEIDVNIKSSYAFKGDFLQVLGNPDNMVLLKVVGDSMHPQIINNDTVLIDTSMCKPSPDGIFAVEIEGMIYLKIINAIPGKLILSSVNSNYLPIEINMEELEKGIVRIVGKLIWLCREL